MVNLEAIDVEDLYIVNVMSLHDITLWECRWRGQGAMRRVKGREQRWLEWVCGGDGG
jgi:hypothetical protein